MSSFAVLLRSVNVGGRNRLPMAELRGLVASLGYDEVDTYLQSGNLTLRGSGGASAVADTIEAGIREAFGLEVPVIVRSRRQLAATVRGNPYVGDVPDPATLHVTFLAGPPGPANRSRLEELAGRIGPTGPFGDDRFEVAGRDIYLHCPAGYATTKLNNTTFERAAGTVATTRNWRTVTTLAAMVGAMAGGER